MHEHHFAANADMFLLLLQHRTNNTLPSCTNPDILLMHKLTPPLSHLPHIPATYTHTLNPQPFDPLFLTTKDDLQSLLQQPKQLSVQLKASVQAVMSVHARNLKKDPAYPLPSYVLPEYGPNNPPSLLAPLLAILLLKHCPPRLAHHAQAWLLEPSGQPYLPLLIQIANKFRSEAAPPLSVPRPLIVPAPSAPLPEPTSAAAPSPASTTPPPEPLPLIIPAPSAPLPEPPSDAAPTPASTTPPPDPLPLIVPAPSAPLPEPPSDAAPTPASTTPLPDPLPLRSPAPVSAPLLEHPSASAASEKGDPPASDAPKAPTRARTRDTKQGSSSPPVSTSEQKKTPRADMRKPHSKLELKHQPKYTSITPLGNVLSFLKYNGHPLTAPEIKKEIPLPVLNALNDSMTTAARQILVTNVFLQKRSRELNLPVSDLIDAIVIYTRTVSPKILDEEIVTSDQKELATIADIRKFIKENL